MGRERAGDVGRKREVVVAHRGQQGLRYGGQIPGWEATHRFLCKQKNVCLF